MFLLQAKLERVMFSIAMHKIYFTQAKYVIIRFKKSHTNKIIAKNHPKDQPKQQKTPKCRVARLTNEHKTLIRTHQITCILLTMHLKYKSSSRTT